MRDADQAVATLVSAGAAPRGEVHEVGGGIRVASVTEPGGSVVGVIENPGFELHEPSAAEGDGPGR